MARRSFTIDVAPIEAEPMAMRVTVKSIDWNGERWINPQIWLEQMVISECEDIPNKDMFAWMSNLTRRAARMIETELDRAEARVITNPNGHEREA